MNRSALTSFTAGLTLVLLASASAPVLAQNDAPTRSTVRGFSGGINGSTTVFGRDGAQDVEHERRIWLTAGYGLTERFAFHLGTSGERAGVRLSQVEGRYTFGGRASRWRPHAAVGLTGLTTHRSDLDTQDDDGAPARASVRPMLAGGISYYFSPALTMDWSLRHTFRVDGNFRCQDGGARTTCTPSTRLHVGVSWYPWAR